MASETQQDRELKAETEIEQPTGISGPANWRRIGLLALLILAVVLLALQMLGGNPGTGVIPGTPIAAPQNETTAG